MNFTTNVPLVKSDCPIDYHSEIISVGSCFADNMGLKFDYFKFINTVNPFGILFHPLAIENVLKRCVNLDYFVASDFFFYNERYHSFEVHSEFSNVDLPDLLFTLNALIDALHNKIKTASHFVITYGTAWVYRNIESDTIVANCHKVPQKAFTKELLSVARIENSIKNTINTIRSINPKVQFIFTISPIRHIKDGFVENQLSKSHLIAALHAAINFEKSNCCYFPSYEIMMDELRDYRFYEQDMLHPSKVAIDYIWQQFVSVFMESETLLIAKEIDTIQKGLLHRPFNPNAESHRVFLSKIEEKITALQSQFSHIYF